MKNFYFGLLIAASFVLLPLACNQSFGGGGTSTSTSGAATSTPTPSGPTPTPTPVTISAIAAAGSYRYSITGSAPGAAISAPITVAVNQGVIWDTSNNGIHPLYIDNGSGTCNVSGNTTFPYNTSFSSTGDYTFHCGNHGACSAPGPCTLPCSLMTGTIHVQ